MLTTGTDLLILALTATVILAAASWPLAQWRRRHRSQERDRDRQSAEAWTELQHRWISVIEQSERGEGNVGESLPVGASYYVVIEESAGLQKRERQAADPKQVPILF